jgi:hypothetical protein
MDIELPIELVPVNEPPPRETTRTNSNRNIPWGVVLDAAAGQGWQRIDYTSTNELSYVESRPEQLAHNLRQHHGVQATVRQGSVYISVPKDREA